LLEIENLTVYYESAIAVNNVNINVGEGEIVAIFGSNGAGKSTLLNSISGLLYERSKREIQRGGERITILGKIRFEGIDITYSPPWDRIKLGISLCPERRRVFPEMTVYENLISGAYLRKDRRKIKEDLGFILELFPSLKERLNQIAGFLSGGEQQMLAIGRALMSNPKLLMLDEPLLGLAPIVQLDLLERIRKINVDRGTSILIAEQYVSPTIEFIDRGYIMETGVITIEGSRKELLDNPQIKTAYLGI
jgi:branched-chain amino acid transport system ATP-binding protein